MPIEESQITIDLQHRRLILCYPADLDTDIRPLFGHFAKNSEDEPEAILRLRSAENGTFALEFQDEVLWLGLVWPDALQTICEEIERVFITLTPDFVVKTGAVRRGGRSILVLGPAGSHKTLLTSWLVDRGFDYLADNFVVLAANRATLHNERTAIVPLALPLAAHLAAASAVQALPRFQGAHALTTRHRVFVQPPGVAVDHKAVQYCGLVIVPKFSEGAELAIDIVRPDELRFLIAQALAPGQPLTAFGTNAILQFAHAVPAFSIEYGDYDQLTGVIDTLAGAIVDDKVTSPGLWPFMEQWRPASAEAPTAVAPSSVEAPALARYRKRLTVGMATYDDYDGVYFTLQSLRLHHPEVADDIEFIVVDNNPDGLCATDLRRLRTAIPHYRYIPVRDRVATTVKERVFEEAASDFVLCLDCHVLLDPGAVARLIAYCEANPHSNDLLQGPLLLDNLTMLHTYLEPEWTWGFLGTWNKDQVCPDPDDDPFEIPMQGMGLFACRRAAWPGFNPHFRGFGGEEGYIHEKFRRAGGRVLCLPFLRWLHRFRRPLGIPYKHSWEDKLRNYMIGHRELGFSTAEMEDHFRQMLGAGYADEMIERVRQEVDRLPGLPGPALA